MAIYSVAVRTEELVISASYASLCTRAAWVWGALKYNGYIQCCSPYRRVGDYGLICVTMYSGCLGVGGIEILWLMKMCHAKPKEIWRLRVAARYVYSVAVRTEELVITASYVSLCTRAAWVWG